MKTWELLVSSNSWEYFGTVLIKAHNVECYFTDPKGYKNLWLNDNKYIDGNTICADGVVIIFDEPFEFHGEVSPARESE